VARKLDSLGDEHWRILGLLARLFPEQFQVKTSEVTPAGEEPQPAASDYLKSLVDWWNDEGVRTSVASLYEQKAWPDFLREGGVREGLMADSRDHWLGLLVLGACRGLGRSTEVQHRSFLEWANREGLWEVFQQPREQKTWMEALEKWQDNAAANLERTRWMSLFPTIFQFSRHLDKYKRLLLGAGRRTADFYTITCLLAPRVDDRLTFAGANFDAPPAPLNMGLHWILRELVRMQVIDGPHLYPDCWVPSRQLVNFLEPLGMTIPESSASNFEKARAVFAFMKDRLAVENPTFFGAFDIPLIYAAGKSSFEIGLDLENDL